MCRLLKNMFKVHMRQHDGTSLQHNPPGIVNRGPDKRKRPGIGPAIVPIAAAKTLKRSAQAKTTASSVCKPTNGVNDTITPTAAPPAMEDGVPLNERRRSIKCRLKPVRIFSIPFLLNFSPI